MDQVTCVILSVSEDDGTIPAVEETPLPEFFV